MRRAGLPILVLAGALIEGHVRPLRRTVPLGLRLTRLGDKFSLLAGSTNPGEGGRSMP